MSTSLTDIIIRTTLQPGDIGYITYLHGHLYKKEYDYGIQFESYVAQGLCEFYHQYDAQKDCVWIAEHNDRIVGFLLLMHRDKAAQLRYFIIEPEYRGIGLGKKLMDLYMEFLQQHGYTESYLWTTSELPAAAALYRRYGFVVTEEFPSSSFGKAVIEQRYDLKHGN
jgi:ribosomal protein S18 acetylase RimI-like enzyme